MIFTEVQATWTVVVKMSLVSAQPPRNWQSLMEQMIADINDTIATPMIGTTIDLDTNEIFLTFQDFRDADRVAVAFNKALSKFKDF